MAWPFTRRPRTAAIQTAGSPGAVQPDFRRSAQAWQDRARFFRSRLGILRFAYGWEADLASRCPLRLEWTSDGRTWETASDPSLQQVLDSYRGETEPQSVTVRDSVWQRRTIGEYVQVIADAQSRPGLAVDVRDPLNVERNRDGYLIRDVPNGRPKDGQARWFPAQQVRRIWVEDDTWPGWASSTFQGIQSDCERYWAAGRAIARQLNSRLAQNGMVWTPSGAHRKIPGEERGGDPPGSPRSALERDFVDIARASLDESQGDTNPALAAPFMVNWPKDEGPPVYVAMGRPFDAGLFNARTEALESIARGLPWPNQLIIDGPGAGGNHWGDWLADEHQIHAVTGELANVCHEDITESYLRPAARALTARGVWAGVPEQWRVGFDDEPITSHPDQSALALQLWQLGLLGAERTLEECGFNKADAPTAADFALLQWVLTLKQSHPFGGGTDPGTAPALPGDGATVAKQPPPALLPPAAAALLAPFPAEAPAWHS